MLSKTKIKWIHALERKKNRDAEGLFVAEGVKIVSDLLPLLPCRFLAVCNDMYRDEQSRYCNEIELITPDEYKKISFQQSPQGILAVFEKPEYSVNIDEISKRLSLALDDIQDPGNLGTIIRLADWFGVSDVFCSEHSADAFSPKTVQATMGALARVRVHYVDLPLFLSAAATEIPVYGTFMNGESIYDFPLTHHGIIVMGNEGGGISEGVERYVSHRIAIPRYPLGGDGVESLNVSAATAITVAEFRRRKL